MVKSLRKGLYFAPFWPLFMKISTRAPEKILGAPQQVDQRTIHKPKKFVITKIIFVITKILILFLNIYSLLFAFTYYKYFHTFLGCK